MTKCHHLLNIQYKNLFDLLYKYKKHFYGIIRTWETDPGDLELKENAGTHTESIYPVPSVQTISTERTIITWKILHIQPLHRSDWWLSSF